MKTFTGWQYLLIDTANHYGLDKLLFEERIQWATDNLADLEVLGHAKVADSLAEGEVWKEQPLYRKGVAAIRKAQQGLPMGHLVGLDACCSGIQVMSAMTGCIAGATSTGMVNPEERADAYGKCTQIMIELLQTDSDTLDVSRKQAKDALMTSFYGSKAKPKEIFGEGTPELEAFYQAAPIVAPGGWELLQDLLASWQPYALSHSWKLPDGFDARVKVMAEREVRIEIDELDHATFSYKFEENTGLERGLSNVANVTHSMDAWVARSMHRRCNYDREVAVSAWNVIQLELMARHHAVRSQQVDPTGKLAYYIEQYTRSTLADAVILPYLTTENAAHLSTEHLEELDRMVTGMLTYEPFELVTVHDEFKAHANNMNHVRSQYREIMAEIADSDILDDLLSQIHGSPGNFNKLSFNLGDLIRQSNYALS